MNNSAAVQEVSWTALLSRIDVDSVYSVSKDDMALCPPSEPVYRSSCALTVHAISHYSPDVLKGHAVVALPLAFLGMHQAPGPDEEKGESHDATLWNEVWQEHVPV